MPVGGKVRTITFFIIMIASCAAVSLAAIQISITLGEAIDEKKDKIVAGQQIMLWAILVFVGFWMLFWMSSILKAIVLDHIRVVCHKEVMQVEYKETDAPVVDFERLLTESKNAELSMYQFGWLNLYMTMIIMYFTWIAFNYTDYLWITAICLFGISVFDWGIHYFITDENHFKTANTNAEVLYRCKCIIHQHKVTMEVIESQEKLEHDALSAASSNFSNYLSMFHRSGKLSLTKVINATILMCCFSKSGFAGFLLLFMEMLDAVEQLTPFIEGRKGFGYLWRVLTNSEREPKFMQNQPINTPSQSILQANTIEEMDLDMIPEQTQIFVDNAEKLLQLESSDNMFAFHLSVVRRNDFLMFRDVKMSIKRGTSVNFNGENGSGKSTILKALMGYLESMDAHYADSRERFHLVLQQPMLINASIRENIALKYFGLPDEVAARKDLIEECAQLAGCEFVSDFADGYDHIIGSHDSNLSGGQKQRVALARALFAVKEGNCEVLMMDEPTAAMSREDAHRSIKNAFDICKKHKVCSFLVTHDTVLKEMCDEQYDVKQWRAPEWK